MKLCKTCYPILSESIDRVSAVKSEMALDHQECNNCGFSNNDMIKADFERLRATDAQETFEEFVEKQLVKTKEYIKFDFE